MRLNIDPVCNPILRKLTVCVTGLLRSSSFCRGFLAVALVKSIHAAGGVDELLLAGEKRMAGRADFHMQVAFFGRTCLKSLTASTSNGDFRIVGMNSWFHYL